MTANVRILDGFEDPALDRNDGMLSSTVARRTLYSLLGSGNGPGGKCLAGVGSYYSSRKEMDLTQFWRPSSLMEEWHFSSVRVAPTIST
jgi:hypothetical protein